MAWALTVTLGPAAVVGGGLLLALGTLVALVGAGILASVLVIRPGTPSMQDHASKLASLPYPLFVLQGLQMRAANLYTWLKPTPLRVAEIAVTYMHSQALFVMVNLGIPESLQRGPKTATELAAEAGPNTNAEWLARVLKLAAELGLVTRTRRPGLTPSAGAASSAVGATGGMDSSHGSDTQPAGDQDKKGGSAGAREPFACGWSCNDVYSANAATAVLCRKHPNCMTDFVKLFEDHYAGFVHLSEGIKTNTMPFMLWSGGRDYWQHLRDSPSHAATFDGAMRACNHTGAKMAVEQYPWQRYDVVVDVGGGNGQFLAELMTKHRKLRGVLVDQKEQVQRGKEWWNEQFQHLLPRMEFVAADMFNASTLPKPAPGAKTLYVLKQILHDWSDTDSLAILRSIRAVMMSDEDVSSGRASLAILETGVMETSNRFLLQHRLEADMTMLMSFGDGKERDEAQTQVLLEAAGFHMGRLVPTTGVMSIIEAAPVSGASRGSKAKVL